MVSNNADNSLSNEIEIKDQYFEQGQTKDDDIEKIRIFLDSTMSFKESFKKGKIIVKDIGEKVENYNIVETYIGCYRLYELSYVDEYGISSIKSYRRFSQFDSFFLKLNYAYPFFIVPPTPEKNPLTKLRLVEESFFENRKIKLQNALNFLNENEVIMNSNIFYKFIFDIQYDDDFFSKSRNLSFKESFKETIEDYNKNSQSSIIQYFNNFLSSVNVKRIGTPTERSILNQKKYYDELFTFYKCLKSTLEQLKDNFVESNQSDQEGAMAFLYFKDFDFLKPQKDFISKTYYTLKQLSGNCEIISKFNSLIIKLESFINLLVGLIECIARFERFLETFEILEYWNNRQSYLNHRMKKEVNEARELYNKFIINIQKEIVRFSANYDNFKEEIVSKIVKFLEELTSKEKKVMSSEENYNSIEFNN